MSTGLNVREIYWLQERTRLEHLARELERRHRFVTQQVQEADDRYRAAAPEERLSDDLAPPSSAELVQLRTPTVDPLVSEWPPKPSGPRCKTCGFCSDEPGGAPLLLGLCELCRGLHGQDFAKPRALLEAILEEPHFAVLTETTSAEQWSIALGCPVGIGQPVDTLKHLRATCAVWNIP